MCLALHGQNIFTQRKGCFVEGRKTSGSYIAEKSRPVTEKRFLHLLGTTGEVDEDRTSSAPDSIYA